MKTTSLQNSLVILLCLAWSSASWSQTTVLTYQGRLIDNGSPADGLYDLSFNLFGASTAGSPLATTTLSAVPVSGGGFTVELDFGRAVFDGGDRWLEIGAVTNGGGAPVALSPRQRISSAPYAIKSGGVDASRISGTLSTGQIGNGAITVSKLAFGAVDNTAILDGTITSSDLSADVLTDTFWGMGGNAGVAAGVDFLGTTGKQPLDIRVNSVRALRLVYPSDGEVPNLIGGDAVNEIGTFTEGAVIGGGDMNHIFTYANYGTIGGGSENQIGDRAPWGTVGGGTHNIISSDSDESTISGGFWNRVASDSIDVVIAGGAHNEVGTHSDNAVIGGGSQNVISSNTYAATVAGGDHNVVGDGAWRSAIAGGIGNANGAGAIAGAIGGGSNNTIAVGATFGAIGGGRRNEVAANSRDCTIAGGEYNTAGGGAGTIGGGQNNEIQDGSNFATIAGGVNNSVQLDSSQATVCGGSDNTINAHAAGSVILGGYNNEIGPNAVNSTIPGGTSNLINDGADGAFAAGTYAHANHPGSFVWSDYDLLATAFLSERDDEFAIRAAGGLRIQSDRGVNLNGADAPLITRGFAPFDNTAPAAKQGLGRWGLFMEPYALAVGIPHVAGRYFTVSTYEVDGSFNNIVVVDNAGNVSATSFNPTSDRNAKQDFESVRPEEVLKKVVAMPIETWAFKNSPDAQHIGPMAQDFRAAFGLGMDDKHIATVDADGVALAAIQGLNRKLETENEELRQRLDRLEKVLEEAGLRDVDAKPLHARLEREAEDGRHRAGVEDHPGSPRGGEHVVRGL